AIVMVDEGSGRILDANRTASAWTGRDPQELQGTSYADLFEQDVPNESSGGAELRGAGNGTRPVDMQSSMTAWGGQIVRQAIIRDISERVVSDRERRIAAEALANIAEGVIIADPERRVISINIAATRIAGFTAEDLAGTCLEDSRSMPDGSPLSTAIWEEIGPASHWSGEVQSRRKDGSTYAEKLSISTIRDAERRIVRYVAVFDDISTAKAAQHRLQHLAAHDPLTGLVNRAEFERYCEAALERAEQERGAAAVMFIDFDAFKFVNDSFSHAIGDELLKLAAERIRQQVGDAHIVGRIGGDEFTVLLPELAHREDAASLADRLLSALSRPFYFAGNEVVLSASIGIAAFPLDGTDAPGLIANADAAMYAAKTEERNTWRFYVPKMQADAHHRLQLTAELRQALLNDEFRLVYQPSVEMHSGRIVGVEALLRWQHPERNEVMPAEFIPVAESIGIIHRIDEWVIHAVCAQLHAWEELGMTRIRVAINVSARWFGHPGLVERIRHALQEHEVKADRIVLEITESAMLRLNEETEQTMRDLHRLGVGVAIDDFGTGYSSMTYLKLPAIAYLKIDSSFVTGLPDDANDVAITTAILAMANSLGLATIAEGIETDAQHEFLLQAGCLEGQGFLYSYPLPPATIERMLRTKRKAASGAKLRLVSRIRS
ncbi:MAG: EAL domain-containing protein, partial [Gammaproteobacteria bacterium]|nr:EAL domain-containing protein [Gammaproteobacteria bacterium]